MTAIPRRQRYDELPDGGPEARVANALRELANAAAPNSARAFADLMRDERWPDGIGHSTISDVLHGKAAANKRHNVDVLARAIVASTSLGDAAGAAEVSRILTLFDDVFRPPRAWSRDITRHCSHVAFDWASALPYGPRDAHEVIATLAVLEDGPATLRTEVLAAELATEIDQRVMQGAPARKAGNSRLPNSGWTNNGDDGPTWHGMWGPVGFGKPAPRLLAVHLDALGAVSVYLRVATATGVEVSELTAAALDTAIQIVCLIGWRGRFGTLVRSVGASPHAQKHREFAAFVPSRDGKTIVNGSARWTTHARTEIDLPGALAPDDSYRSMVFADRLTRQVLDLPAVDEED